MSLIYKLVLTVIWRISIFSEFFEKLKIVDERLGQWRNQLYLCWGRCWVMGHSVLAQRVPFPGPLCISHTWHTCAVLLHSFQQVPWQQNDGEVNSPPLNACQAASAATIPDRFVDTAIKADRNKGVEAAAQGNSDEGENAASEGAEQGQGAASEGWLCVCVWVWLPISRKPFHCSPFLISHSLFVCTFLCYTN